MTAPLCAACGGTGILTTKSGGSFCECGAAAEDSGVDFDAALAHLRGTGPDPFIAAPVAAEPGPPYPGPPTCRNGYMVGPPCARCGLRSWEHSYTNDCALFVNPPPKPALTADASGETSAAATSERQSQMAVDTSSPADGPNEPGTFSANLKCHLCCQQRIECQCASKLAAAEADLREAVDLMELMLACGDGQEFYARRAAFLARHDARARGGS